jgi:hypothetical protein
MYTLIPKSYTIIVHKGKASGNLIIAKEEHKDYEVAMARLDTLEAKYYNRYIVEFLTNY